MKVYFGFNVEDISSFTTIDFDGVFSVLLVSSLIYASEAITNSIVYSFEQTAFIELATRSLYRLSKISCVKEFGTLIFNVSEDIDIGSQLLIQVLKLTSLNSLFMTSRVFSHKFFRSASINIPPIYKMKIFFINIMYKLSTIISTVLYYRQKGI